MKRMKCETPKCKNKPKKHSRYCYKCLSRQYRERNPMKAAYYLLRSNAKRRGHEFNLTFDEFKLFCYKTDYIVGKGRTKESYSIDRIDPRIGYTYSNLRMLTVSDNSKKGAKILQYDWQSKIAYVFAVRTHTEQNCREEAMPF